MQKRHLACRHSHVREQVGSKHRKPLAALPQCFMRFTTVCDAFAIFGAASSAFAQLKIRVSRYKGLHRQVF